MKRFFVLSALFGCYVSTSDSNATPDAGQSAMPMKHCGTWNAQYEVQFHKLSGDCPNIDDKVSYQWIDEYGVPVVPQNCNNMTLLEECTWHVNEDCKNWVYEQQLTGEMDWSPSGEGAHGYLTFTVYELDNQYLFCSSVYETTYTLQWQAAN